MLSGPGQVAEPAAQPQPFPSLSQFLGSIGEGEVLLEQPVPFIKGKRSIKRDRRTDVEYLVGFQGYPPSDDCW